MIFVVTMNIDQSRNVNTYPEDKIFREKTIEAKHEVLIHHHDLLKGTEM